MVQILIRGLQHNSWYEMGTAALNFFYLQNFELSQNISKLLTMLEAVLYN